MVVSVLFKSQVFDKVAATASLEPLDFVALPVRQVAPFKIAHLVADDF